MAESATLQELMETWSCSQREGLAQGPMTKRGSWFGKRTPDPFWYLFHYRTLVFWARDPRGQASEPVPGLVGFQGMWGWAGCPGLQLSLGASSLEVLEVDGCC
jgi:hypothetical protein